MDTGAANLGSVLHALERLGAKATVSTDAGEIAGADRVILPGVGSAGRAMARLHELNLVDALRELQRPLLGICLGMQLLYESSEEGDVACLGVIDGRVTRLRPQAAAPAASGEPATPPAGAIRVPHMGWNGLNVARHDPLLAGIDEGAPVYFVHSYAAPLTANALATCRHGREFPAVVGCGNRYGMQFHPERSGPVGSRLLANFMAIG